MEDHSTLALLLAAITGSSGIAGAVAWFATLRPRIEALEKAERERQAAQERLVEKIEAEQAAQWSAIRKHDRTLTAITSASRAVLDHQARTGHGVPSRVPTDATPIVHVSLDGPDDSHS